MKTPMKVDFEDTVQNWRLWGQLVQLWVYKFQPKPTDLAELVSQMTAHGITGANAFGSPHRKVKIFSSGNEDPLVIVLPTLEMLKQGRKAANPGKPYPLPDFYDDAYSGQRKVFTADDDTLFVACRIGEYTINECT